jgi:hypothetical protein
MEVHQCLLLGGGNICHVGSTGGDQLRGSAMTKPALPPKQDFHSECDDTDYARDRLRDQGANSIYHRMYFNCVYM